MNEIPSAPVCASKLPFRTVARRRLPQFSLRTMLTAITLFAAFFAFLRSVGVRDVSVYFAIVLYLTAIAYGQCTFFGGAHPYRVATLLGGLLVGLMGNAHRRVRCCELSSRTLRVTMCALRRIAIVMCDPGEPTLPAGNGRFCSCPVDCIRSRQRPNADVEAAHLGASLEHLGNISYRLGNQQLIFDAQTEKFVGHDAANQHLLAAGRKHYRIPDVL